MAATRPRHAATAQVLTATGVACNANNGGNSSGCHPCGGAGRQQQQEDMEEQRQAKGDGQQEQQAQQAKTATCDTRGTPWRHGLCPHRSSCGSPMDNCPAPREGCSRCHAPAPHGKHSNHPTQQHARAVVAACHGAIPSAASPIPSRRAPVWNALRPARPPWHGHAYRPGLQLRPAVQRSTPAGCSTDDLSLVDDSGPLGPGAAVEGHGAGQDGIGVIRACVHAHADALLPAVPQPLPWLAHVEPRVLLAVGQQEVGSGTGVEGADSVGGCPETVGEPCPAANAASAREVAAPGQHVPASGPCLRLQVHVCVPGELAEAWARQERERGRFHVEGQETGLPGGGSVPCWELMARCDGRYMRHTLRCVASSAPNTHTARMMAKAADAVPLPSVAMAAPGVALRVEHQSVGPSSLAVQEQGACTSRVPPLLVLVYEMELMEAPPAGAAASTLLLLDLRWRGRPVAAVPCLLLQPAHNLPPAAEVPAPEAGDTPAQATQRAPPHGLQRLAAAAAVYGAEGVAALVGELCDVARRWGGPPQELDGLLHDLAAWLRHTGPAAAAVAAETDAGAAVGWCNGLPAVQAGWLRPGRPPAACLAVLGASLLGFATMHGLRATVARLQADMAGVGYTAAFGHALAVSALEASQAEGLGDAAAASAGSTSNPRDEAAAAAAAAVAAAAVAVGSSTVADPEVLQATSAAVQQARATPCQAAASGGEGQGSGEGGAEKAGEVLGGDIRRWGRIKGLELLATDGSMPWPNTPAAQAGAGAGPGDGGGWVAWWARRPLLPGAVLRALCVCGLSVAIALLYHWHLVARWLMQGRGGWG